MILAEQDPYEFRQRQATGIVPPSYPIDCQPSKEKLIVLENLRRDDREIERKLSLDLPIDPVILDDYWRRKGRKMMADKNASIAAKEQELSEREMDLPAYPRAQLETFEHSTLVMLCRQYKRFIPGFDQKVGPQTPTSQMVNWVLAAQELCGIEPTNPNAPVVTPDTIGQIGLDEGVRPAPIEEVDTSNIPMGIEDLDDINPEAEPVGEELSPDLESEEGIRAALQASQGGPGGEVPADIAERFGAGALGDESAEEGVDGPSE